MDDRGFIFTADATLALIVVIVLTASVVAYELLPSYMGEDHQHLEALADSVLAVMEQDGTLTNAAFYASRNDTATANQIINNRLEALVPLGIGFNLTMDTANPVSARDDRGISYSTDTVTKVKVISAPEEGWMGRAWYKLENVTFINQPQTVTTTVWNFHNWLSNFAPWSGSNAVQTYPNWGKGSTAQNISFPVPNGALNYANFLIGTDSYSKGTSFGADVIVNANKIHFNPNQSIFIGPRSNDANQWMYNYQGIINTAYLKNGTSNNFTVNFQNMSSHKYDLPWFSIIANYNTSFITPVGILNTTVFFPDAAGLAVQTASNLTGKNDKNQYGLVYNLKNGTVTGFDNKRVVDWNSFYNKGNPSNGYDDGTPFVITGANAGTYGNGNVTGTKTAVSITKDVPIPAGKNVLDSFVVVNAYGGDDGALVEVWNGTTWRTIFCSFNVPGMHTSEDDGYGNTPGIIYIPAGYLMPGQVNKVRITTWDDAPGGDYDLVGLTNCYVTAFYTGLNVRWMDTPFDNYQATTYTQTQTKTFGIYPDAKEAYLFVGTGVDSRNITVKYSTGQVLYSGSIPYYLDLAALDASKGYHIITTTNSTATNYNLTPGTYGLTVTLNSSSNGWESGDTDAEIFSGTRISIIYPEILENVWATAFANDPNTASSTAAQSLSAETGVPVSNISSDAIYTGNMPNQIPVRLDLWKQ